MMSAIGIVREAVLRLLLDRESGRIVMVGGAVAHPAAISEPDVRLSTHPALQ
jgi:hypothetical protein